jgi:hypothetical protein
VSLALSRIITKWRSSSLLHRSISADQRTPSLQSSWLDEEDVDSPSADGKISLGRASPLNPILVTREPMSSTTRSSAPNNDDRRALEEDEDVAVKV